MSPTKQTTLGGTSPTKRTGKAGEKSFAMSPSKSPSKLTKKHSKKSLKLEKKEGGEEEKESGLASPTSITMQNSFIIKNADESFDAYYHQMRKRKVTAGQAALDGTMTTAGTGALRGQEASNNFGVVSGVEPAARDGHSSDISDDGLMFVFGGDRHHMPFNDLYLMRL